MPRQPAAMSIAQLEAEIARRRKEAKRLARNRTRLQRLLKAVETRLAVLKGTPGQPKARKPRKRRMSAAGRARIAAAQRARWARSRAGKKAKPVAVEPAKKKRRLSAAGIAKIRAAARARWAKFRAAKARSAG